MNVVGVNTRAYATPSSRWCQPVAALRRRSRRASALVLAAAPFVMVNSCTGKMGHATAEAFVQAGINLIPYTFTGYSAGVAVSNVGVSGIPVEVVGRERRQEVMDKVKQEFPGLIIVDYTLPSCVNDNAEFYIRNGTPFVMGTTGGDREALTRAAEGSGVYAVISQQMGKQVAAMQALIEMMASQFPGSFQGWQLEVVESHQSTKVDPSGTAQSLLPAFEALGTHLKDDRIVKIRDARRSMELMGVPEEALSGHAFHTYTITNPDNTVQFVFKHNVVQRAIYAEGTVDAVLFLAKQIEAAADQKVYTMLDVLKGGALR